MNATTLARAVALGRVAAGSALLAAPSATGGPWTGRDARRAGTRVFARGLGARDILLGAGALAAAGTDREAALLGSIAFADVADGWATWQERERLPATARLVVGIATGAAAAQIALAAVRARGRAAGPPAS